MNFLPLRHKQTLWENSKVVIIPTPYEKTTSYGQGTVNGPRAIIEASSKLELYDIDYGFEPSDIGFHTLSFPPKSSMSKPKSMLKYLYEKTCKVIEAGKLPVILGGEHTVTLGPVQCLSEKYKNLTVLSLDAHTDLREKYFDDKFSHACVLRRVLDYVKVVEAGIRSTSLEEQKIIKKFKVPVFYAEEIISKDNFIKKLMPMLSENLYVTIDIDVFDPGLVPSTGTPEPGGLGWYDVIKIIKTVASERNVVGFDLVELSPVKANNAPDFMAAKLVYKFASEIFFGKNSGK